MGGLGCAVWVHACDRGMLQKSAEQGMLETVCGVAVV